MTPQKLHSMKLNTDQYCLTDAVGTFYNMIWDGLEMQSVILTAFKDAPFL